MMLEIWLIELLKGIGRFFMNPLVYWTVILLFIIGYRRIRKERHDFGRKIHGYFTEIKGTFWLMLLSSIIISSFVIVSGLALSMEILVVWTVVMLLFSMLGGTSLLSPSYSLGMTTILLIVLPFLQSYIGNPYIDFTTVSSAQYVSLAVLVALLLLVESLLLSFTKEKQSFPKLYMSERGVLIGNHQLKRLLFLPFFLFIPTEAVSSIAPILPYFYYGEQSFSLVFFPVLLGYRYDVQSMLPIEAVRKLSKQTYLLSIFILLGAVASLYYPVAAFPTIFIALICKEWITYRHKSSEGKKTALFRPLDRGVKVLGMLPNSPADRLDIAVGEVILKVNDQHVSDSHSFYAALQTSTANFKLHVIDYDGEVRFVHGTYFAEEPHELGILFIEERHTASVKTAEVSDDQVTG